MVEDDFLAEGFFGLRARFKPRPGDWIMPLPELPRYRDEWLRQANEMANVAYAEPLRPAIFPAPHLSVIDIVGERAVARKKFNGVSGTVDGGSENLDWQTSPRQGAPEIVPGAEPRRCRAFPHEREKPAPEAPTFMLVPTFPGT